MVLKETELGYKVLIDEKYEGLVFHNRVFRTMRVGDKMVGYIDLVRRDGKIDVVLQPIGAKSLKIANEKVLEVLRKNGGKLSFTYKSDAEEIKRVFEISKKVYKRALTELIEAKSISLNSDSISLIRDN
jgi:predicted RNA-binding protein (virulence factor B family)